MFGYVNVNKDELTPEQQERYHSYYCGLCRALQKRHGRVTRVTLSFDMAFLSMLLSSLYECPEETGFETCLTHPIKKHAWVSNEYVEYCADMTIALSYYKLLDDWADDHNYMALSAARLLQSKHLAVARRYPLQCSAIHNRLGQLAQLEKDNCHDLDRVSSCFGELLAELFDCRRDMWSQPLRQMGYSLGKFIYLMDAYEDLDADIKKCRFNPLLGIAGKPGYEEHCKDILTLLMADCAAAYEKLPCLQDSDILRNVLYSGVWTRYNLLRQKAEASQKSHPAPETETNEEKEPPVHE